MLARSCRLGPAASGALLRTGGGVELLALHPDTGSAVTPEWLSLAGGRAAAASPLGGVRTIPWEQSPGRWFVIVPIEPGPPAIAAVYLVDADEGTIGGIAERLALAPSLFESIELHARAQEHARESEQLRGVLTSIRGLSSHDRHAALVLALSNHAATAWDADRVSLGLLSGREVRLAAISHTEHLNRRSTLTREIEAVMEECLDQDVEVVHPSADDRVIARTAREFAGRHGVLAMVSVPLRREGRPFGVLTLERERAFEPREVAALRLLADAASVTLWMSWRHRRWFGSGMLLALRELGAAVVGPRHTWAKLTAMAIFAAAIVFALVPGTYRVVGTARVEAEERRVVPAPFDGYLTESLARVGDVVDAGTALAALDATDLLLRLGAGRAELDRHQREAMLAQRERKTAEAQIASAEADRARAEIELLERQIAQAEVTSPVSGVVLVGELERSLGAPVSTGDVLFEVAPLESLRVDAYVPEDQIGDVQLDGRGAMTLASRPDVRLPVVVERIDPLAEVRVGRNVLPVPARLLERPDLL
ncbi:MAG: HlyD family efflux transporter periplasmic adaptor subunit, partial [Phycisphaerales bacterium]|nr:HlyD family efflux transporter periplasmic adaptor subunit [Phycisphaerales bacterium]